jgi:4'-phosphopantetheinyl transferase
MHTPAYPRRHPALCSHEVHVWSADLQQPNWVLSRLAESLSAEEHRRARAYRIERHQRCFIASRGILREIIARYVGTCPEKPSFRYGPMGKPELACQGGGQGVCFNLAMSEGTAVYAFSGSQTVGIDIENMRNIPEAERLVALFFPPRRRPGGAAFPLKRDSGHSSVGGLARRPT